MNARVPQRVAEDNFDTNNPPGMPKNLGINDTGITQRQSRNAMVLRGKMQKDRNEETRELTP